MSILLLFRALFRERSQLALENLALRQQLAILRHKAPRPRLRRADRAFWVSLAQVWDQWPWPSFWSSRRPSYAGIAWDSGTSGDGSRGVGRASVRK